MISYELSMGLALVGLLMAYQDVRVDSIVQAQGRLLTAWGATLPIPNWGIFLQPVGFLLFLVASFAETNRNPFDLAEGESELVAGYHVEYSSVKFALFFMAEYVNMAVAAFILSTLFLGGYQVPFASTETLQQDPKLTLALLCGAVALLKGTAGVILYNRGVQQARLYTGVKKVEPFLLAGLCFAVTLAALGFLVYGLIAGLPQEVNGVLTVLLQLLSLSLKVLFFCWLFVWVRWTLPRFRYDQLMKLGWKLMLPLGLLNLLVTGVIILTQKG